MNSTKFYVARKNKTSGRVDLQRCKCLDNFWVSPDFARRMPLDVWQFSKRGAENIVKRYNKSKAGAWYEYFVVPVTDILNNEKEEDL